MKYAQMVVPGDGESDALYPELAAERWGEPDDDGSLPAFVGGCRVQELGCELGADYSAAALDHPSVERVRGLFDSRPVARDGFGALVTRFWPVEVTWGTERSRGSSSGHYIMGAERVAYVTVFDPVGCYEGLMHEWGHLRLWTLGVGLEEHDGALLVNGEDERYISPIRRDKLRPMSAVLHGVYCWVLMNDARLALWDGAVVSEAKLRSVLAWDLPKIEEGIITLGEHAQWSEAGRPFGDRLLDFAQGVVDRGWDALGRGGREAALRANREWVVTQNVAASPLHGLDLTGEEPR